MATPRTVLVVNAGSSSLKYQVLDADTGETSASGIVERIGGPGRLRHSTGGETHEQDVTCRDHTEALDAARAALREHGPDLGELGLFAVGHRVVHGGPEFTEPVVIDDDVVAAITDLVPLAPLHNPANLEGIRGARAAFPDVPQVAVFDTAFHQSLPPAAFTYAVPESWRWPNIRCVERCPNIIHHASCTCMGVLSHMRTNASQQFQLSISYPAVQGM